MNALMLFDVSFRAFGRIICVWLQSRFTVNLIKLSAHANHPKSDQKVAQQASNWQMSCAECRKFLLRLIPCPMRTRQDWTQSAASATCTWRDINQQRWQALDEDFSQALLVRFFSFVVARADSSLEPTLRAAKGMRPVTSSNLDHNSHRLLLFINTFPGASLEGFCEAKLETFNLPVSLRHSECRLARTSDVDLTWKGRIA